MMANLYGDQVTILMPPMLSSKQGHADMKIPISQPQRIDSEVYHRTVLCLPVSVAEDEIDNALACEARELGVRPPQISTNVNAITSSLSATTIASDPTNKSSIMSQSTAPTSCASSEYRPGTSISNESTVVPSRSIVPSILSDIEKKRYSGFRSGIRKMAGFRKRRSLALDSSTTTSIDSETSTKIADHPSLQSGLKSPASVKSGKSYFSSAVSTTKTSYETEPLIDQDARTRTLECVELQLLRSQQLEERSRFLEYQASLVSSLRQARDAMSSQRRQVHKLIVAEQSEKNDKAVEDLESRQLEEELKMLKEHDFEKRAVMTRLRHMEAYCQNPTPPPTPIANTFDRNSLDSQQVLPERKVTDRDYHNLAQQYRERDLMDNLHNSKINVLRGRQKKAVENLILKRERELERLEQQQEKEIDAIEHDFGLQEAELRQDFRVRGAKLESRWRLQNLITKTKMEKTTGLSFEPLPDVMATEEPAGLS